MRLSIPLPPNLLRLQVGGKRQFHPGIKYLFRYILAKYQPGTTFTISPASLASQFGVTERTIRNWLAFYVRNHWIFPVDRRGGRGKHATFYLYWGTQYEGHRNPETENQRCGMYNRTDLYRRYRSRDVSTYQGRMEVLRSLPDSVVLRKGQAYYRWAMEAFRRTILKACPWTSRQVSDTVCDGIGRYVDGKTLGEVRSLIRWFMGEIHTFVLATAELLKEGLRRAYRGVVRILRKFVFGEETEDRETTRREGRRDLETVRTVARVFSENDRRIGKGPVRISELLRPLQEG